MVMQQYFDHYAEAEVRLCKGFPRVYDNVLCIPAFAEDQHFLDYVLEEQAEQSLLVIVVVNSPANSADEEYCHLSENTVPGD